MQFNSSPSTTMHIDLNSCFATIEQQANPFLRGKPLVVAAYNSPAGCILAPSIEAKTYGIKTGMRVKEGKKLYPDLIVLTPDPAKYRDVHIALREVMAFYSNQAYPKSIDEFVLNLKGYPALERLGMKGVGKEIKERIKKEVGEWMTVSVGIAPNRFLAKTASGLRKPDGLDEINKANFLEVYKNLSLTDLNGISYRNQARLNSVGIYTVTDFYASELWRLKAAFSSINGYYWYLRLRGWEIDDFEFARKSFGNSYALPKPYTNLQELSPILSTLVEKTSSRLRSAGYKAKGLHIALNYRGGGFWHKGETLAKDLFETADIYKEAKRILSLSPRKPVQILAISCFNLLNDHSSQLELFESVERKKNLTTSIDRINKRWGEFTLASARRLELEDTIHDRIAFGGVRELG